jgi:hypothetical protein
MRTSVRWLSLAAAGCALAAMTVGTSAARTPGASHAAAALAGRAPKLYTVVTAGPFTAPPSSQSTGTATCPAGTVVWGGGVSTPGRSAAVNIAGSLPQDNSWYGDVNSFGSSSTTFSVYAVCAMRPRKYTIGESATFDTPPVSQSSGTQACPGSATILGGGSRSTVGSFVANINSTLPVGNGWQVDMASTAIRDTTFNVYAICGKAPRGYSVVVGAAVSNPPSSISEASVSCPGRKRPLSGGALSSSRTPCVDLSSTIPDGNGWSVWENNTGAVAVTITAYAICA